MAHTHTEALVDSQLDGGETKHIEMIMASSPRKSYHNIQRLLSRAAAKADRKHILLQDDPTESQLHEIYPWCQSTARAMAQRFRARAIDAMSFGAGDYWAMPMGRREAEGGLMPSHDDFSRLLRMHLDLPDPTVQFLENELQPTLPASRTATQGASVPPGYLHCRHERRCQNGNGRLDAFGWHAMSCVNLGCKAHHNTILRKNGTSYSIVRNRILRNFLELIPSHPVWF